MLLTSSLLVASIEPALTFQTTMAINAGQVKGDPLFLFSTTDIDLRTTGNGE